MEIKNVLFAEALDAWLLCYGGKEEDVEYVGEWNRLARVLCKLALDDEFVEYAREKGYRVDLPKRSPLCRYGCHFCGL